MRPSHSLSTNGLAILMACQANLLLPLPCLCPSSSARTHCASELASEQGLELEAFELEAFEQGLEGLALERLAGECARFKFLGMFPPSSSHNYLTCNGLL